MSRKGRIVVALAVVVVAAVAWFGLEGTPPELAWSAPPGEAPVAGLVELSVTAADARTGLSGVEATMESLELEASPAGDGVFVITLDTAALPDGAHLLQVRAKDRSLRRNESRLEITLRSDNSPPRIELARSSLVASQGGTLAVLARFDEPVIEPRVRLLGQDVALVPIGDDLWRALFGIAVEQAPGSWTLEVAASDEAGNRGERRDPLEIAAGTFEQGGFIQLTGEQTAARQDQAAADASNDKRRRAYAADVSDTRWAATFDRPSEGRLTSPFGKHRTYSDGRMKHHKGTDIAAPSGTPVRAPAGGVVTLAEELHIYGKTVIVKHGPRVSSSYSHLSAIDVEVGDVLERGQAVGEIGSTGQSTGPHLHWGMVVGGVAVDAEEWTRRDFGAPVPGDFDGE